MSDRDEMRTDRGRAGYRTVLSWRRTALTTAAVGFAAVFSLVDQSAPTEWLSIVVVAGTVTLLLTAAALRGAHLTAGVVEIGRNLPLAAMSGVVCLCAGVLLVDSALRVIR
ncbi:hypothetical protein BTO20_00795 [Mycobacterium dioxanotrophicus]|uniref:DUF202 domain-containing protein n=1 Tax=Mycobacterium dioxanotrophicus TaxID=482462 RepID=A0A1Y0BWR3_9MYCO|nr:DUF202 domain-containing protein [Mycobacterium dioxanotrophicus]ART67328.1 hypothetical protein BTO20_00795 [Mycobacterium dioxanotrophicus]